MTYFILTFVVLIVVIAAMSVGVIFANKPILGSCGGMGALGVDTACDICGGSPKKCEEERQKGKGNATTKSSPLFYDGSDTKK